VTVEGLRSDFDRPRTADAATRAPGIGTFLATDVLGFRHVIRSVGDEASAALAADCQSIVSAAVEANNGIVLELVADSALAVFHNASDAVQPLPYGRRWPISHGRATPTPRSRLPSTPADGQAIRNAWPPAQHLCGLTTFLAQPSVGKCSYPQRRPPFSKAMCLSHHCATSASARSLASTSRSTCTSYPQDRSSHRRAVIIYGIASARSGDAQDFYNSREEAEATLAAILRDEPTSRASCGSRRSSSSRHELEA
jgi:hypothetical protein